MWRVVKWVVQLACVGVFVFAVYVRVVPVVPAVWHVPSYPSGLGHTGGPVSHIWRGVQDGDGTGQMARLDRIILGTQRTALIAGSVREGMATYVTRSQWWGFPDFTTVERGVLLIEGGPPVISIHSRSRFGSSDFGVNEGRVRQWVRQLQAGG